MTCICCGGAPADTAFRDQFGGAPLVSCSECGHIQVAALPSPDALRRYYEGQYSQTRGRFVGRPYLAVMRRRARAQADFIERALGPVRGLRVCDLGCGYGALVAELRARGADAIGLDYDPACVEHCRARGLPVDAISGEEEVAARGWFDLVTLSHTLEHVRDVEALLRSLRRHAGALFIEVPTYSLGVAEAFRDQEGHLNFFNPRSFERLLQRHALTPSALAACGPPLELYWSERAPLPALRRVARTLSRDWFFRAYSLERADGMWVRALCRTEEARA